MAPIQTTIPRSYETKAQKLIRQAMWRRGTTYRRLAERLSARGIPFTRDNLVNKISRSRFSAGFLLLCLDVLED